MDYIIYIGLAIFSGVVYYFSTKDQRPVGLNGKYSQEYKNWIATFPNDPKEFPAWWKKNSKGWSFMSEKNDTPDSIFKSKRIDCGRITTILVTRYGGKYKHIFQGLGKMGHAVWENTKGQKYWISFNGMTGKVCLKWEEIWGEYK